MPGLKTVANDIARKVCDGLEPGRIASLVDYNEWLWNLGSAKVQRLLAERHTLSMSLDSFTFDFVVDGLRSAWDQHCRMMGWIDHAFTEAAEAARAQLLAKLDREEEAEKADNLMEQSGE